MASATKGIISAHTGTEDLYDFANPSLPMTGLFPRREENVFQLRQRGKQSLSQPVPVSPSYPL